MSRRGSGHSWKQFGSKTMDKAVNTTEDLMLCSNCQGKFRTSDKHVMLKEYIKSIDYINSCHSLLNQIVPKQKCENAFSLPDIPNFVNVFSIIYNKFQKGKNNKSVHELDNIESLDEIFSRIDLLDTNEGVKNPTDSEGEARRNFSRRRVRKHEVSDEENSSVANNKKIVRNSSIPRPVSSEKGRRQIEEGNRLNRQEQRGKYVHTAKIVRGNAGLSSKRNGGGISEEDLEKYAKELLRSRSESPSTPRSISSNSRSPSPASRKLNGRVPSRMKLKSNVTPKMPIRVQKKLTPTISESEKLENTTEYSETNEAPDKQVNEDVNARREPVSRNGSKMRVQHSNHSADVKKPEAIHETVVQGAVDVDARSLNSPDNSLKIKHSDHSGKNVIVQHSDHQYVFKQKPNDFFTQRRRLISDIINKPLFPDSDVDSDREVKAYNSESDIDDDVFEKKSVKSTRSSKAGEVNNTYNLLKMSISRPLSNSVLSNIGILTNSGKIKPEKEQEMIRLKNNLSKDKQNASFRQPRNRPRDAAQLRLAKTKASMLLGNMSSPSSEIKSDDEEEISSHPMESHARHHTRNHY